MSDNYLCRSNDPCGHCDYCADIYEDSDDPFLDWRELFTEEQPDEEWLFDGVFAVGRGHAIYAEHKQGKSLFALWCCAEMATTRTDVDVIYLDYEMTRADVRERLEDMGYGVDSDMSRFHYALLPTLPPLDTGEGAGALLQLVDQVERPDCHVFVVIDTTSRAVEGKENDNDTIRGFYQWTGIVLKRRGVTWARLDHAGKDLARGQRGGSAKGDDVDVIWKLIACDGGMTLYRDAARMAWVDDQIMFLIRTDPLRYLRGYVEPEGTNELILALDRLGVPLDAGRPTARRALREAGVKAANAALAAALRGRRIDAAGRDALSLLDPGQPRSQVNGQSRGQPGQSPQNPTSKTTQLSADSDGQLPEVAVPVSVPPGTDRADLTETRCITCNGPPHETVTHRYVSGF
jgi:AAA domain